MGRLGRIGIVTADILDRGKKIMTHKGLQFVMLAVAVVVFAAAGLVSYFVDQKTDKLEERLERMEALLVELAGKEGADQIAAATTPSTRSRSGTTVDVMKERSAAPA